MYQILRDYNTTFREISLDSNYSILIVIKLSTTFFFHVHVLVLKVHQHRFSSLSGIVRNGAPGDVIVVQNNFFFLSFTCDLVGKCWLMLLPVYLQKEVPGFHNLHDSVKFVYSITIYLYFKF